MFFLIACFNPNVLNVLGSKLLNLKVMSFLSVHCNYCDSTALFFSFAKAFSAPIPLWLEYRLDSYGMVGNVLEGTMCRLSVMLCDIMIADRFVNHSRHAAAGHANLSNEKISI